MKFAAIILLAIVGSAVATDVTLINMEDPETQMALTPSNEEETAGLVGDATMFADFCIRSRDYVIGDIKKQSNQLAATVFSMFFQNAAQIGQNALNVERDATDKLGNQIRDPSATIAAPADGDVSAAMIAEGQQRIQEEQTQPRTFFQAVIATVGATGNAVASGVVSSLQGLSKTFGFDKVTGALTGVCNQIAHYEEQNKAAFEEFAKAIAAKDANLGATPFENVACLTTRRISRLDGICKFSAVAQGPVSKIMKSIK